MRRKLYALLILIGTVGAILLTYLYFFVYYTATLTINSNVPEYRVELFAKSTAKKWTHECPENECVIRDVAPFDYNITISKGDYESESFSAQIGARRDETIFIDLEKKVLLEVVTIEKQEESSQERIQRLREENIYYARFQLSEGKLLVFREDGERLSLQYRGGKEEVIDIAKIPKVPKMDIRASYISGSEDIFISAGNLSYIFDSQRGKIFELPFEIQVSYIKLGKHLGEYLVVTEKGVFTYNLQKRISEYQYIFKDYLYIADGLIGIIYDTETQKKKNFNIQQSGNLIVKYNPRDKTRKILYETLENIERIEWKGESIIMTIKGQEFELQNFQ